MINPFPARQELKPAFLNNQVSQHCMYICHQHFFHNFIWTGTFSNPTYPSQLTNSCPLSVGLDPQ